MSQLGGMPPAGRPRRAVSLSLRALEAAEGACARKHAALRPELTSAAATTATPPVEEAAVEQEPAARATPPSDLAEVQDGEPEFVAEPLFTGVTLNGRVLVRPGPSRGCDLAVWGGSSLRVSAAPQRSAHGAVARPTVWLGAAAARGERWAPSARLRALACALLLFSCRGWWRAAVKQRSLLASASVSASGLTQLLPRRTRAQASAEWCFRLSQLSTACRLPRAAPLASTPPSAGSLTVRWAAT